METMNPEETIASWLHGPYDEKTKEEIRRLQESDPAALLDAFRSHLSFGTGGIRALMGVGPNRLNIYTIRQITRGLAEYVKETFGEKSAVCIGYDVREGSRLFAEEAARTLAGQNLSVFLFSEVAPTPLVSFACRHLGCKAAVMITASHNPAAYNGYKVYGQDGAQLVAPHDKAVLKAVEKMRQAPTVLAPLNSPLISPLGEEIDALYVKEIGKLPLLKTAPPLSIIYSNLHGTGLRLAAKALSSWGYSDVSFVAAQQPYDGTFPKAPSPNPEEKGALALGSQQLLDEKKDLFLATDPDADRVGAVIRVENTAVRLSGHQIAVLCLEHILSSLAKGKKMPKEAACIKTIVTTELFKRIADHYGCACIDVLTGFKYIGEKIGQWEKKGPAFLFGAEESYGYLFGSHVRDKDALSACCLIAEAAAAAKAEGKTLLDQLYALYVRHGVHREKLLEKSWPAGTDAMAAMQAQMEAIRKAPPTELQGKKVARFTDYLLPQGDLPKADVLRFDLEGGGKVVIRPSGTEPKIKLYLEIVDLSTGALPEAIERADKQLEALAEAAIVLC